MKIYITTMDGFLKGLVFIYLLRRATINFFNFHIFTLSPYFPVIFQNTPSSEKIWEIPLCPAKPNPPHLPGDARRQIFKVFSDFSGKFPRFFGIFGFYH